MLTAPRVQVRPGARSPRARLASHSPLGGGGVVVLSGAGESARAVRDGRGRDGRGLRGSGPATAQVQQVRQPARELAPLRVSYPLLTR